VLLLERGRHCARKVLVASSPLYQSLDEVASMSYQISVLQRVEIKEGASRSVTPSKANTKHRRSSSSGATSANGMVGRGPVSHGPKVRKGTKNSRNTEHAADGHPLASASTESDSPYHAGPRKGDHPSVVFASGSQPPHVGPRPRFREEAVDELLQLKLLQTLLDAPAPPARGSTIVLASGDAAKSQFNPQGFLGCVRKALERGWRVEVVSWEESRSRAWTELKEEFDLMAGSDENALKIIGLDKWGMDLLDNDA
jgi:hypothetical protein